MAIIRFDIQMKAPSTKQPSGWYYWSNIWYGNVNTPGEFEFAQDHCYESMARAHCGGVLGDRLKITNMTTGVIIQEGNFHAEPVSRWGPIDSALINTLYCRLLAGGQQKGFKRIRMPVPSYAHVNGVLTPAFMADYRSNSLAVFAGSRLCNSTGVLFDDWQLSPLVYGWQFRHGTERSARRRLHP